MPESELVAGDRVRILLTLVPFLLERGEVSLADAAAAFDVPEDEMRSLVEKLTLIGLPGESGYFQMPHEMFDIDWDLLDERDTIRIRTSVALERAPKLTAREASALIAGLQLAGSIPQVAESAVFAGLMDKLARAAGRGRLEVIVATDPVDEVRALIASAQRSGRSLVFDYRAPDAPQLERTVDPFRVIIADGLWYLHGWCHLRRARRTFLIDRMSEVRLGGHAVRHEPDAEGEPESVEGDQVTVAVPSGMEPLLGDYLQGATVRRRHGEAIVTFAVPDPRVIKRLAARLGGRMRVVSPESAQQAVREWASQALALYEAG